MVRLEKRSKIKSVSKIQKLFRFAYLIPPLAILWFITRFGFNVPVWDQWELVELFRKVAAGSASFQDFFVQHNEHRILFPKLIITALAFASHWNVKYELYFSGLLVTSTFLLLYKIVLNQSEGEGRNFHLANFFMALILFSFVQWENWLQGFGMVWFLVNLCLVLCLFIFSSNRWSTRLKLFLGAICCTVASFSLANGLLVWLAVIPSLINHLIRQSKESGEVRKRILSWVSPLLIWGALFIACCGIYLIGYVKPASHPDPFFFLKHPFVADNYFFTLLGSPLLYASDLAFIFGFLVFLNFIFFIIRYIRNPNSKFSQDAILWISLGLFAVLSSLLTTIGRAGFGIVQAESPRYATPSILLLIALIQLWRIGLNPPSSRSKSSDLRSSGDSRFIMIGGLLTFLVLVASINSLTTAERMRVVGKYGQVCLEVADYIDRSADNCLKAIFFDPNLLRNRLNTLRQIGLRDSPPNLTFVATPPKPYGLIEVPPPSEKPLTVKKTCLNCGDVEVNGWAILPDQKKSAELVLLSYGSGNGTVFSNAYVNLPSPEVAKVIGSPYATNARWTIKFSPKRLPLGQTVISGWVYNAAARQLVQLNGAFKIKVED
ncbi:MAG: hypothetical protein WCA35_16555 [Kovacikia sp.]